MSEKNQEMENTQEPDPIETPVDESSATPDDQPEPESPLVTPDKPRKTVGPTPYAVGAVLIVFIVIVVFAFVGMQKRQERSNQARNRLAQGQAAMVDHDYYRALYEFTMALQLNPNLAGANSTLGRISIANSKGDDAIKYFNAELRINPGDRQSRLALGCIYALGCISPDDPHQVKGYLLSKFPNVIPFDWAEDLTLSPDIEYDPLTSSVFHFQYALEHLPSDPAPEIGLAFTDLANYNLDDARQRLSRLAGETDDNASLGVIQSIIEDINSEEQYRTFLARTSGQQTPLNQTLTPPDPTESEQSPTDLGDMLDTLPPMIDFGDALIPGSASSDEDPGGGFGDRDVFPFDMEDHGETDEFGLTITRDDLVPQPTVKPISRDIHLRESNDWVHTVRIANRFQSGDVGFREGETIIMPHTNVEVTVVESSDERIVLREHGNEFVWVKGDVGWVQEKTIDDISEPIPPGITVHPPEQESEPVDDQTEDGDEESVEDNQSPDDELGPDVS